MAELSRKYRYDAVVPNPDQIAALEYHITRSQEMTPFGKKLAIWLIRATQNFTRQVKLLMPAEVGFCREVNDSLHDAVSSNGTTDLNGFLQGMGVRQVFSRISHENVTLIWLANAYYADAAEPVAFNLDEIDAIDLDAIQRT